MVGSIGNDCKLVRLNLRLIFCVCVHVNVSVCCSCFFVFVFFFCFFLLVFGLLMHISKDSVTDNNKIGWHLLVPLNCISEQQSAP